MFFRISPVALFLLARVVLPPHVDALPGAMIGVNMLLGVI